MLVKSRHHATFVCLSVSDAVDKHQNNIKVADFTTLFYSHANQLVFNMHLIFLLKNVSWLDKVIKNTFIEISINFDCIHSSA